MKLRSDFVTNSSSSSFVIAYQEPKDAFHAMVLDVFLDETGDCDSTCATRVDSLQALEPSILRWCDWTRKQTIEELIEEDTSAAKVYQRAKKALSEGLTVAFKEVSYYNATLHRLSDMLVESGDMTILLKEG